MIANFKRVLTLFLVLVVQLSFAQQMNISGVVSDNVGAMLGVNVIKKGTDIGIDTDILGAYTLKAKPGDVLVFSYIGYETVEKVVGSSNKINVRMKEAASKLDVVVVVGYSSTTKESFTGTAKVVDSDNINAKSVSNVSQALAGEASGVSVVRSGKPGKAATVRIRGFSSIDGNNAPLYVVDGVPFLGDINSINPADIENTVILKDASSTAIYGSRGANGVILITTKKGKSGKNHFEFDFKTTVNLRALPSYDIVRSPEEYIGLAWTALKNRGEAEGLNPTEYADMYLFDKDNNGIASRYNIWNVNSVSELINPLTGKVKVGVKRKYTPENWADYGYQNAIRKEMNFKMSGGDKTNKHYFSLGYLDDVGFIKNSGYERYSARMNFASKPLDWLKTNVSLNYNYDILNDGTGYGGGNVTYMLDYTPPIYGLFLRDELGKVELDPHFKKPAYDFGLDGRGFSSTYNGVGESFLNLNKDRKHSINGDLGLVISLMKGLTLESTFSTNIYSNTLDRVRNSLQGSAGPAKGGTLFKQQSLFRATNFNQILRYRNTFENVHSLEVLAAHESNEEVFEFFNLSKNNIVNLNPDTSVLPSNYLDQNGNSTGYIQDASTESYFSQFSYDFDKKYFLTGTVRRDGTSRFYKHKWGTFWSFGSGWVVSNESFLKDNNLLSYLKLKASYGVLGDQGRNYYNGQVTFAMESLLGAPSLVPSGVVDPDITWESSNQFQFGTEFSLFNDRIDVALDYYSKKTTNLFVSKKLAPSTGDSKIKTNDGELLNNGFEFDVTGHVLKNKDYGLSVSINGETFTNSIVKMPIDNATNNPKVLNTAGYYGRALDHGIFDFYMKEWRGVDPKTGDPQWTQHWVDTNSNGEYEDGEGITDLTSYIYDNKSAKVLERLTSKNSDATQKFIGKSSVPKLRGAFRLNTYYKGFSLSTQLAYSYGGYGYDAAYSALMSNGQVGMSSYHKDMLGAWSKDGDVTDVPKIYGGGDKNSRVNSTSSRFVTSSDYLALNNFILGYRLPSKYLKNSGISGLSFSFAGDNLFLLSARKGYNPTISSLGNSDAYAYKPISSYTIGVNLKL